MLASACPTFFVDIVLAENFVGDINLDGLVNIYGSLKASDGYGNFTDTQITRLHSKYVTSIDGDLGVYAAPLILGLSFLNL